MYPKIKSKNIDPYFWTTPASFFFGDFLKARGATHAPSPRALEKVLVHQILKTTESHHSKNDFWFRVRGLQKSFF